RLVKRYNSLVKLNMNPLASLAPAINDIAAAQKTSFATTQAVWRFLNNDKISFKQLNEPIYQLACEQIKTSQHRYALVVHDWSQLPYVTYRNQTQGLQRTHPYASGYELQTGVLVDAASGLPIAPSAQTISDASGCYSTSNEQHTDRQTALDPLTGQVQK